MPNFWDYIHVGRSDDSRTHHNLQEGLFQIASQTCSILVQVNNTNNISYGNNASNIQYNNFNPNCASTSGCSTNRAGPSTSTANRTKDDIDPEQSIVLLPAGAPSTSGRHNSTKNLFANYKHRLSTVLEGSQTPGGDDDFELWDQSQMLRSEQHGTLYKWGHGSWCKPSCIPITVILVLIVLVVLLPLLDHPHDKASSHIKMNDTNLTCIDLCGIQIVESIPDGLVYPKNSPTFMSTFDAWQSLILEANHTIDIASYYWTLRGSDIYNHSTAWQGEKIFQLLLNINKNNNKNIKMRIVQNAPTQSNPNYDTEILMKRKIAEVRSVNFNRLIGGGVLHTKLWIIDGIHIYLGSANMDWRALTQVKEMGVMITNCTCLANDVSKIFDIYWDMGKDNAQIPINWPEKYNTKVNMQSPLIVNYNNNNFQLKTYLSNSPPQMTTKGRTSDLDAIINVIMNAEKFIHISVMDYFPITLYTPKIKYWPHIDNALRTAALEHKVSIKLLISWWNHSRSSEDYFLRSIEALSESYKGVDIQVKRFIVPSSADQSKIPYGRVNHNKYMVTDRTAYIGTSNWSGDYFINTAGIGLIMCDNTNYNNEHNDSLITIRTDLANVFERDWNSMYAVNLIK